MRIKFFVVAFVWLFSALLSAQAQSKSCGCPDRDDMLYRIYEIKVLIAEYQNQIKTFQAANTMFSQAEKAKLKAVLQNLANTTRANSKIPVSSDPAEAGTDPHSCNVSIVNEGTSCLEEAILVHESFHSNVCHTNKPSAANPLSDYRDGKTMAEYVREEIDAYTVEMAFLRSELAKLPDSCKPPNWYLSYEITVTGEGGNIQVVSGGTKNQIKWKIYHRYSGSIEFNQPIPQLPFTPQQQMLMSPAQIIQAMKKYPRGSVVLWKHQPPAISLFVPMDVFIKDEINTFIYEPGEGDAYEQTTTTETWDGNGTNGVMNQFDFFINSVDKNYNVAIPIMPMPSAVTKISPQVRKVKKEVIDRTKYGYGGKPTHEEPLATTTMVSFDSFEIPTIAGLLEKAVAHHSANLPLNFTLDTLTFDSGMMKPTLPYLKGLPDAEKKVKIKVY